MYMSLCTWRVQSAARWSPLLLRVMSDSHLHQVHKRRDQAAAAAASQHQELKAVRTIPDPNMVKLKHSHMVLSASLFASPCSGHHLESHNPRRGELSVFWWRTHRTLLYSSMLSTSAFCKAVESSCDRPSSHQIGPHDTT